MQGIPPDASPRAAGRRADRPPARASRSAGVGAARGVEPLGALRCEDDGDRRARERVAVPWLGFADDPVGGERPASEPLRIGRLRVDPKWSADELPPSDGARDRAIPSLRARPRGSPERASSSSTAEASGWPAGRERRSGSRRHGGPTTGGSKRGSARRAESFGSCNPEASPAASGGSVGAEGSLFVQERTAGRPPDVLARADFPGTRRGAHVVRIVRRGRASRCDGMAVRSPPHPSCSPTHGGEVGPRRLRRGG